MSLQVNLAWVSEKTGASEQFIIPSWGRSISYKKDCDNRALYLKWMLN